MSESSTELVPSSYKIWKDIENQVNGKLNSKSLYMNLSKNRNNIKNKLLAALGKPKLDDSNVLLESSSEPDCKSSLEDDGLNNLAATGLGRNKRKRSTRKISDDDDQF